MPTLRSAECRVKIWQVDINLSPWWLWLLSVLWWWFRHCFFHGLLLLPLFWGVWCYAFVLFCTICSTLCPFYIGNHLAGEERASCFTFFLCSECHITVFHGTMGWSVVCNSLIVPFPSHSHLLFECIVESLAHSPNEPN